MPTALYYRHDPFAPKPNQPTRFGSAVVVSCKGQILLEHRKYNFRWGVISGDIRDTESFLDCAISSIIPSFGDIVKKKQICKYTQKAQPILRLCFCSLSILTIYYVEVSCSQVGCPPLAAFA